MILLAAFCAGFAALVMEVVGVHFMAPWFGTSSLVWSNQIGLILAALAVGAALGGAAAGLSNNPRQLVAKLFVASGLILMAGVLLLPMFASWLLPDQLRLDEAASIFLGGSFTSSVLFFCPPVLLLGMVAPLLVEIRSQEHGAGSAAGAVSAAGTIGSLVGVFGSSFFFVPVLGVSNSLLLVGFILLLSAWALGISKQKRAWSALGLLLAAICWFYPGANSALANLPDPTAKVIAVRDTSYQHLRVLEMADGRRWLQMNEGVDSYQSLWLPPEQVNAGNDASRADRRMQWPGGYYDLFTLAPLYAFADITVPSERPAQFWSLGFGCGTALGPVDFGLAMRPWRAIGVELDPVVIELAEEFMPLPKEFEQRIEIVCGDARSLLRAAPDDLDFILLDAYARQFEIPLHLATSEFFTELNSHLRPGGVVAINLGTTDYGPSGGKLVASIFAGLSIPFGKNVRAHRVPWSRNLVIFARKGLAFPDLARTRAMLPAGLPFELGGSLLAEQVLEPAEIEGGVALCDERNSLLLIQAAEWLRGSTP